MHNPSLEALIPDIPLREYRPAGFPDMSAYRRAWLKLCWGFKGWARRVWISAAGGEEPLAVSISIEELHCSRDVQEIIDASRPSHAILSEFALAGLELTESGTSGDRTFRWTSEGFSFEQRIYPIGGGLLCDSLAMGRERDTVRRYLDSLGPKNTAAGSEGAGPLRCHNGLLRFGWSFIMTIVFIVPIIFIPGMIATAVAPEAVFLIAMAVSLLVGTYTLDRWFKSQRLRNQRRVWTSRLHQGDNDGTIRRALASIGFQLPEA